MRKNSIYLSSPGVYTAIIEDREGVIQFTKKLDEYQNALDWCLGMTSDDGFAFKVTDTDTKRVLSSGRNVGGTIVPYDVSTKEEPVMPIGVTEAPEVGIATELEHKDLIVKMLIEAGQEPTEDKIRAIAKEIARVHVEEDPRYYEKLEKVGL